MRRLTHGFEPLEDRRLLSVGAMQPELFGMSPALFVENQGQWADPSVAYMHQGDAMQVALTDAGAVFRLYDHQPAAAEAPGAGDAAVGEVPGRRPEMGGGVDRAVQFSASYVGANAVTPVGQAESQSVFHYQVGDAANWRDAVPAFEAVAYEGLYDGIDLAVWGQRSQLKYEFYVDPGADWQQIQVRYDGIEGLSIGDGGSLIVDLGGGWEPLIDAAPYVYQQIGGRQVEIASQYVLIDPWTFGFELLDRYDPDAPLVIDPELAWSTYLGGSGEDYAYGVAVDGSGNVVVTGETFSSDWVAGPAPPANDAWNAFVTKLSPAGQHLWTRFLGGDGTDFGQAVAVDSADNIVVAGETGSSGWVSGGFDTTFNGIADGFVAKLNPSGQHLWSTYLGGSNVDFGQAVAVDSANNILVAGETNSADWTSGGFDTSFNGNSDAFVVKITSAGAHVWSTYLGGSGWDRGDGVAVDSADRVLVTGWTSSAGWTSGGFDTTYNGNTDAFVAKLTSNGGHVWSTYLGGANTDRGYGIASFGSDVVVTGWTASAGWTTGGFDTALNGVRDAFVARLTSAGGHVWSTYLGGADEDYGWSIATSGTASILVTGGTRSPGWASGGFDTTHNGNFDAYVAALSPAGGHQWSTYLGGANRDFGNGIAVDPAGTMYVTGETASAGWVHGGFSTTLNGSHDAFVAKIEPPAVLSHPAAIGTWRNRWFSLDMDGDGQWDSSVDESIRFGGPDHTPIIGDWNGDGVSQIGVWRNGWFNLKDNGEVRSIRFGGLDHTPIIGDWNGDGVDQIGVWRNGWFNLHMAGDGVWDPAVDQSIRFGRSDATPIIGDFNGDGVDHIGTWRNGWFSLDMDGDGQWDSSEDRSFRFGASDATPIIGTWSLSGGQALHAAGLPANAASAGPALDQAALDPLVVAAIADWDALIGLSAAQLDRLQRVEFVIAELPGTMLGRTRHDTIYLDPSAAGFGWYINPADADFESGGRLGELTARPGTDAVHRIDLLTAVMHEMGHVLGHDHTESGLMQPTLRPGVRWLAESDEPSALAGEQALLDDGSLQPERLDAYFAALR